MGLDSFDNLGVVLVRMTAIRGVLIFKLLLLLAIVTGTAFSCFSLFREYKEALAGRVSRRVDSFLPVLKDLSPALLAVPSEALRFLAYYNVIDHEFPATQGVQEMLGYCTYYSGAPLQAVKYFEKALRLDGNAFAARYNLGVIYYLRADYERASGYFQEAISLSDGKTFAYVMGSRIFSQLRVVNHWESADVLGKIRREYGDAQRFLRLCMEKQGKNREIFVLAARYKDLYSAWSANGGQPTTMELIVF